MFLQQTLKKGHSETFGGDGHVYYIDSGDNLMGVCNVFRFITLSRFYAHQLYLNKSLKKGHKETCGGVIYIYYLDCGNNITGVCIHPYSSVCAN